MKEGREGGKKERTVGRKERRKEGRKEGNDNKDGCIRLLTFKFGCQEQHGQHLIETSQPAAVYLTVLHSVGLQELLEHHSVLALFSRGNSYPVRR